MYNVLIEGLNPERARIPGFGLMLIARTSACGPRLSLWARGREEKLKAALRGFRRV